MEGSQNYSGSDSANPYAAYTQPQYMYPSTTQMSASDGSGAYGQYNYYYPYSTQTAESYTQPDYSSNNTAGWYQQENLSYTNYLPDSQASTTSTSKTLYKTKLCRHFQTKGF